MAVPCSKCGAEIQTGAQFCAVCGTAVVPGVPPSFSAPQSGSAFSPVNVPTAQPIVSTPPASSYTPPPPPPVNYPAAAQPAASAQAAAGYRPPPPPPPGAGFAPAGATSQSGGGSALKIVLIVLAILVGIGMLGAGAVGFMVWRVAHAIHVANRDGTLAFHTPDGNVSAGAATNFTADELGTDIYPGAKSARGGMRMSLPSGSVVSAAFVTADSKDQVLAFYKDKLGSDASVFDSANSAMISVKKGPQENIMVTISSRASENEGKTKISIVHTKNKSAS